MKTKETRRIELLPELAEEINENEMLVVKGGSVPPVGANNCSCTNNLVCW